MAMTTQSKSSSDKQKKQSLATAYIDDYLKQNSPDAYAAVQVQRQANAVNPTDLQQWQGKDTTFIDNYLKQNSPGAYAAVQAQRQANAANPIAAFDARLLPSFATGLDSSLLESVSNDWKSTWGDKYYYDAFDPEDIQRQLAGAMPKYLQDKYDPNDEVDSWLLRNNLPYKSLFNDSYSEAYLKNQAKQAERQELLGGMKNTFSQYDAGMSSLQREFNQRVEAAKAAKADAAAQQKSRKKSQNISTDLSEGEMADILGELLTSGKYDNLAPFYSENKTSGNDVLDYMAGISGPDYSLYDAAFAAIRRGKTPPDEFFANFKQADYEKWLKKQLGFDEYSLLDSLMAAPAAATAPSSTNAAAPIGTAGVPDDRDAAQIMIGVGEALPTAGKTAVQNGDLDAQIREAKTAQQMAQRSRDYRKASEYEQLIEDLENQKRTGKDGVPAGTVGAVDASQSRKTRVAVPEQYAAQQDAKQPEMDALEQRIKEAKTAQHMALQNGDHEKAEEYKQLVKDLKDQQKVEKQAQEAAQRQAIHEYMSSPEIQAQLQSETGYKSFGDDWIRWNELATLPSLNKEERKEAKAAVNDILEKYPYMQDMRALEYSPSIVELYSYLKAKSNPGAGFGAGFGNALGIPWLTDRLIPKSSVESLRELQRTLSGEEPPAWVSARQFNAEIAQAHPTASTTGSMAANVLMLGGASALAKGGTGLIKGFSKLAPWVQRAVNSGLSFGMKGGYQALARTQTQEEWDAAEQQKAALSGGQYIPQPYNAWGQVEDVLKEAGIKSVYGFAGGAASTIIGEAGKALLIKYNMQTPLAEAIRQGVSATAFARSGAAATYFLYDEEHRPTKEQMAQDAAVAFIFAVGTSVLETATMSAQNKAQWERAFKQMQQDYQNLARGGGTYEETMRTGQRIIQHSDDLLTALNQNYYAGQQQWVDTSREVLTAVKEQVGLRMDGMNAAANAYQPAGPGLGASGAGVATGDSAGPGASMSIATQGAGLMPDLQVPAMGTAPGVPVDTSMLAAGAAQAAGYAPETAARAVVAVDPVSGSALVDAVESLTLPADKAARALEVAASAAAIREEAAIAPVYAELRDVAARSSMEVKVLETTYDAKAVEVQTSLARKYDAVQALYADAQGALEAGDLNAHSVELQRLRTAIRQYEDDYTVAQAKRGAAEAAHEKSLLDIQDKFMGAVDTLAARLPDAAHIPAGAQTPMSAAQNAPNVLDTAVPGNGLSASTATPAGAQAIVGESLAGQAAGPEWLQGYPSTRIRYGARNAYSSEMQKTIQEYMSAVDPALKEHIENAERGQWYQLQDVSPALGAAIEEQIGVNPTGYKTQFEARQIRHVDKEHGPHGEKDHSLSDVNDLSRIQYVLDNFDFVDNPGRSTAYWEPAPGTRSGNRSAKTVRIGKQIDSTYYVVEAVPATDKKTVYIVTAFIGKAPDGQMPVSASTIETSRLRDAQNPSVTSKTSAEPTALASDIIIPTAPGENNPENVNFSEQVQSRPTQMDVIDYMAGVPSSQNQIGAATPTHIQTATDQDISQHSAAMQQTIVDYKNAVDTDVLQLVQRSKEDKKAAFLWRRIGDLAPRAARDIERTTGENLDGGHHRISSTALNHILKRHGENGVHDHSLADMRDIARIPWVLQNYDYMERTLDQNGAPAFSDGIRGSDGKPAPLVSFIKRIDGTFYVIEAVAENRRRICWVESAFIKKGAPRVPHAQGLGATSETTATEALNNIIPTAPAENNPETVNFSEQMQSRLTQMDVIDYMAGVPGAELTGGTSASAGAREILQKNAIRARAFYEQFDTWKKTPRAQPFELGITTHVLQQLGVETKKITLSVADANHMAKHIGMSDEVIRQVPQVIHEPILVMKSRTVADRLTMFGDVFDEDGVPVLVILDLLPNAKKGHNPNTIRLNNAYGKDKNLQWFIDNSVISYVEPNQERTRNWLAVSGLQLPSSAQLGFNKMVTQGNQLVNNSIRHSLVENASAAAPAGTQAVTSQDMMNYMAGVPDAELTGRSAADTINAQALDPTMAILVGGLQDGRPGQQGSLSAQNELRRDGHAERLQAANGSGSAGEKQINARESTAESGSSEGTGRTSQDIAPKRDGVGVWTQKTETNIDAAIRKWNADMGRDGYTGAPLERADIRPAENISAETVRLASEFNGILGKDLFFYDSDRVEAPDGYNAGREIFVRDTGDGRVILTAGHEYLHSDPKLRAAALKVFDKVSPKELADMKSARAERLRRTYGQDYAESMSEGSLREELVADLFGAYLSDVLLGEVADQGLGISDETYYKFTDAFEAAMTYDAESDLQDEAEALSYMGDSERDVLFSPQWLRSEQDQMEYYWAGKRGSVRNSKTEMAVAGNPPFIQSYEEFRDYIRAIRDGRETNIKTFGKVDDRLAKAVRRHTNDRLDIAGKYLEVEPSHMHHAENQHSEASFPGSMPLGEFYWDNLPVMIDEFDTVAAANTGDRQGTRFSIAFYTNNGAVLIPFTVSEGRVSVHPRNMIGYTYEAFTKKYRNIEPSQFRGEANASGHDAQSLYYAETPIGILSALRENRKPENVKFSKQTVQQDARFSPPQNGRGTYETPAWLRDYPSTSIQYGEQDNYSLAMQNTIQEYMNAVDPALKAHLEDANRPRYYRLKDMSSELGQAIYEAIGINPTGYKTLFEDFIIDHVNKHHGPRGTINKSMRDKNDIARLQYILDTFDFIDHIGVSKAYSEPNPEAGHGQSRMARAVRLGKQIDSVYYVAEAVPDAAAKQVYIASMYIENKQAPQGALVYRSPRPQDVPSPLPTSETLRTENPNKSISKDGPADNPENVKFSKKNTDTAIPGMQTGGVPVSSGTGTAISDMQTGTVPTPETKEVSNNSISPEAGLDNLENVIFSKQIAEPVQGTPGRRSRAAENLAKAVELFKQGETPVSYYEKAGQEYDHQVAAQLSGICYRNNIPVGGAQGQAALEQDLQSAKHWNGNRLLQTLKNTVTTPQRIFEDLGHWRPPQSPHARTDNYLEGERLKDRYFNYGMVQGANKNLWMNAEGEIVAKAYKGGGIYESALAQMLGEGDVTETEARAAVADSKTMIVPVADGLYVLDGDGHLKLMADSERTVIFNKRYRELKKQARAAITKIERDAKLSDTEKQEKIREEEQRAKQIAPEIADWTLHVERSGNTVRVVNQASGEVLAEVRGGKAPNVDIAIRTKDAIADFYARALPLQNKVLVENGYRPIREIKNYFPHQGRANTGLSSIMASLRGDAEQLPTKIAGLTGAFTPGRPWVAHALERMGSYTEYNAIRGFEKYLDAAGDLVFYTPVVRRLRQLEKGIRHSSKGSENAPIVTWLHNYANHIANKKADIDRSFEGLAGREAYTVSDSLTRWFGASAVVMNVSVSLSNWVSFFSAIPSLDARRVPRAIKETLAGVFGEGDGFAEKIPFLTLRAGAYEKILVKQSERAWRAGNKVLGFMFAASDRLTTEIVARAKYAELMKKGYLEADAARKTSDYCLKIFADRSKGMTPALFTSRLLKPLAQFQLEAVNQLSHFRDIHYQGVSEAVDEVLRKNGGKIDGVDYAEAERKIKAAGIKDWGRYLLYLLALSLWGRVTEAMGINVQTWDPYGMARNTVENYQEGGVKQAAAGLGKDVVDQTPFANILTGSGRVPVGGGLESVASGVRTLADEDATAEEKVLGMMLGLASFVPAGAQLRKTVRGAKAVKEGGYYTQSGRLRYPISDPGDIIQALVFGPSAAAPGGYDWSNAPLTPAKTKAYETLVDEGLDPMDVWYFMAGYNPNTNATEALSILTTDADKDGQPDFDAQTMEMIAAVMGLDYNPRRDGSLERWAKKESDRYLNEKRKKPELTEDERKNVEAIEEFWQILVGMKTG